MALFDELHDPPATVDENVLVRPIQIFCVPLKVPAFVVGVTVVNKGGCPTAQASNVLSGVKAYEPLAVLLIVAGDHVPTIPLGEVVDKIGATEPEQKGGMDAKLLVKLTLA